MFFVFLASFSATGVLMVLKTNQKAASKDDSVPKEAVVEIFNPDTKKELSAELTNKEESIASQPAKKTRLGFGEHYHSPTPTVDYKNTFIRFA
jgi:hypothetical protein